MLFQTSFFLIFFKRLPSEISTCSSRQLLVYRYQRFIIFCKKNSLIHRLKNIYEKSCTAWSYTTFLQQVCKYYCSGVSCIQSVPKTYFLYKSVANKWSLSWFAVIAVTGFLAFISPFTICRNIYLHYFMFMYIAQLNNIIFCHGDSKRCCVDEIRKEEKSSSLC